MINPAVLLKLRPAWHSFRENHPKFPGFMRAVCDRAMQEGTLIEVTVTTPDGKTISSNLKLKDTDMELFESVRTML